jgi:hypothetical protein
VSIWVARHGMTSGQYQAQFTRWSARASSIRGDYGVGVRPYAAIWDKSSGLAWKRTTADVRRLPGQFRPVGQGSGW